jgi:hypothetical protein
MVKDRRNAHIYQRAHMLAESGLYVCPRVIIATLVADGYPEATELLNTDNIRADLLRACEAATPARPRIARQRLDTPPRGRLVH